MKEFGHRFWQAWVFLMTWLIFPYGTLQWWIDPKPLGFVTRPWSFVIAAGYTVLVPFLMWVWIKDHRSEPE
jgi:hypothetical protein